MNAEPQWTERMDKRGLDPLGMQNAGVLLYQTLLPGISNVTLRMRYYGFYCWVSDAYARSGVTDDFEAWRTWIRRSEALYALVSSHAKGQGGVGGVEWADRRLAMDEDVIDFAEAASVVGSERYLRQSLGVFGGAYYSQMVEMGLFRQGEHGIQRATNVAGIAAADGFRTSIGTEVETLLAASIRSARIGRSDLAVLRRIIPSDIPDASHELETYQGLLFPGDGATSGDQSRSSSLQLILRAAEALGRRPDPDSIRWHLFEGTADAELDDQRLRWEAYHCQDMLQVAAASLLEWAMDVMGEFDTGRTPAEIGTEIRSRLEDSEPEEAALSWQVLRSRVDPERFDYRAAWARLTSRRGTAEQKSWDTVRLIIALDRRLAERERLGRTARRDLGTRGGGRSILTELEWLGDRADQRVAELVAGYVVERVVLRHSWVAMQKLRRQRDYTFLFETHDGRLVRRGSYAPVPTTPRLAPAVQFLVDVGIVGETGPTQRGLAILGGVA